MIKQFILLGCLVVALGVVFMISPIPVLADGPVAYWQLDETSGPPYDDFISSHEGTCSGQCPAATAGKVDGGQLFNATTGVAVPPHVDFNWNTGDSFSFEVWLKGIPGQTCAGAVIPEVAVGRGDIATQMSWGLGCNAGSGAAYFHLGDTTGISATLISTKAITDGQWRHLAGVRDGAAGINRLYVDGIEVTSATISYSGTFSSLSAPVNIGYLIAGGNFQGTLDEVIIYNEALSSAEIRTHYYLARGYASSCAEPVRIMPLGDSITAGHNSGVEEDEQKISYRKDLWDSLQAAGYQVDFVGSQLNGQFYAPDGFDPNHEGHSGFRDDEVAFHIYNNSGDNWLGNNATDVILLHIGTNGLDPDPGDVEDILNEVDEYEADFGVDVTVILARIIHRMTFTPDILLFNENIAALAQQRIANGDKIIIVDMETGAGIDYQSYLLGGDMFDNLHPYASGYTKMAAAWFDPLSSFLPTCPSQPQIISTPSKIAIEGEPYTYNVEATGFPPPTYTLTAAPPGMVIDQPTGLISWTPAALGAASVTVEATNESGSDSQSYTINVVEAPVCLPSTTSYWTLDEITETTFADGVGGLAGQCAGECPTPEPGKVNGGQTFNGNDTGIDVPADSSFGWGPSDSFSIEFWLQAMAGSTCEGNSNEVFIGRDDANSDLHWWIGCRRRSGDITFTLRDIAGAGPSIQAGSVTDGQWHYVAAVRDGVNKINRLYVDGQEVGTANHTYASSFASATAALNMGWLNLSAGYHYEGLLDEVAIHHDALTVSQIQEHFVKGIVNIGYCESIAVALPERLYIPLAAK
jgi:hypothetical protein